MSPSLLRTLWVVARASARPRIDPLDTGVVPLRVWPGDVDLNLHVNNGRFLTLMDLGRVDFLVRSGLWRAAVKNRWRPIIGSATIRFRRSLPPLSTFELHTRMACWDSKWAFIEQRFVKDDAVCAVGFVKGLFRSPAGNVPMAELLAATGRLQPSPPMPAGLAEWVAAEEAFAGDARLSRRRRSNPDRR